VLAFHHRVRDTSTTCPGRFPFMKAGASRLAIRGSFARITVPSENGRQPPVRAVFRRCSPVVLNRIGQAIETRGISASRCRVHSKKSPPASSHGGGRPDAAVFIACIACTGCVTRSSSRSNHVMSSASGRFRGALRDSIRSGSVLLDLNGLPVTLETVLGRRCRT